MIRPLIILGSGGHARVLVEALRCSGAIIAGMLVPQPVLAGPFVAGVPILGDDAAVTRYSPSEILLVNGLGSTGLPTERQRLFERFKVSGYTFATVVHPSAVIASDVQLDEGAQIMAGAVIQPGCHIGANSIVNTRASVDHDCSIGDHVHLAPGVTLSGAVIIEKGSHLGTAATVIQSIRIAAGCLVAAGALVTQDLCPGARVRGVPARKFS